MHPEILISFPSFGQPPIGNYIKVDSIGEAHQKSLAYILLNGIDFVDQRKDKMKTVYNLMITIKRPLKNLELLDKMHNNGKGPLKYNKKYLDVYANKLIKENNEPELCKKNDLDFDYTYNDRLRKRWSRLSRLPFESLENEEIVDSENLDQISAVIELLKKNPNTRRAVCVTWIPSIDLRKENVPCLNWLVYWNVDGYLHGTMGFRSHDFYGAYPANVYGLSRLLEYVANGTGLKVGSLTTVSVNAHYNRLFEKDVLGIVNFK